MAYRLLLIDRDPLRREEYARGLRKANYQVDSFDSGKDAITYLLVNPVHCVILDYSSSREAGSPISAGKRLVREITQADAFVPLILLCSRGDELDHETTAATDIVLRYPVADRALADAVATLFSETLRQRAQRKSGYIFAFR